MKNTLSSIGLCFRARKISLGTDTVIDGMRNKSVSLVFLANDASSGTIKKITDKAKFYNVEVDQRFNTIELSKAVGKSNRVVLGILDKGFAKLLRK